MIELSRRQFLQGLAAAFTVAALPASISLAERVAQATETFEAPGWRFIVRGGSGVVGDSILMLAPGVGFNPYDDGRTFMFPEMFDIDKLVAAPINRMITLTPWKPYFKQLSQVMPDDIQDKLKWMRR